MSESQMDRMIMDARHSTATGNSVHKGTISIDLVREALQGASDRNFDGAALLERAGISAELMVAPKARVTAMAYANLWAVLADVMDDEFFGMDAHPMRRGSFRLMCQVSMQARNLGRALHRMLAFLRSVLDDVSIELHEQGDIAFLRVRDRGPASRMFTYATLLILVHGLSCWLIRRRIPLIEARFRCPMPDAIDDYRTRFCSSFTFGAPVTQVSFQASFLQQKLLATDLGLRSFLRGAPANLLVKYRDDAGLAASVHRRLRRQSPNDWPELDILARDLNLTATTLQRRLHNEGTAYQKLKDDLRRDISISLLSTSRMPVTAVAEEVGFQETSAFYRAFKKWTGISPGAYRSSSHAELPPKVENSEFPTQKK